MDSAGSYVVENTVMRVQGISRLPDVLLVAQERMCCMDIIILKLRLSTSCITLVEKIANVKIIS